MKSNSGKCTKCVHFLDCTHENSEIRGRKREAMTVRATFDTYETLLKAYDYFNEALFGGQLPEVIITYHRQRKVMGYASIGRWVNAQRQYVDELAVNPEYFAKYPLIEICQTLCHEMAHIWQAHFGKPGRRGYHNIEWAKQMTRIGLMPSSNGLPGGEKTGEWMMDYVIYDGAFHRSCQALLGKGFMLPWVDRYPVQRLAVPILVYDLQGHAIELDAGLFRKPGPSRLVAARTAPVMATATLMAARDLPPGDDGDSELLLADSASIGTDSFVPADTPTPAQWEGVFQRDDVDEAEQQLIREIFDSRPRAKSGRIKYCCKTCHIQVWGKPGLNIECGDCKKPLLGET